MTAKSKHKKQARDLQKRTGRSYQDCWRLVAETYPGLTNDEILVNLNPRFKRGFRDGEEGKSPTDATDEYLDGYMAGRRVFLTKSV